MTKPCATSSVSENRMILQEGISGCMKSWQAVLQYTHRHCDTAQLVRRLHTMGMKCTWNMFPHPGKKIAQKSNHRQPTTSSKNSKYHRLQDCAGLVNTLLMSKMHSGEKNPNQTNHTNKT